MKKLNNSKILNTIITTGITLTLLLLILIPLFLTAMFKTDSSFMKSNLVTIISIGIYICAIPYVLALIYLKKLCKLITDKNPFSKDIPNIIRKIAYCSFSELILFNLVNLYLSYFYGVYLYALTIMSCLLVSFISLSIGFFALVSSKLFEITLGIKDENDKTI